MKPFFRRRHFATVDTQPKWHRTASVERFEYTALCGYVYSDLLGDIITKEAVKTEALRCLKCDLEYGKATGEKVRTKPRPRRRIEKQPTEKVVTAWDRYQADQNTDVDIIDLTALQEA